MRPKFVVISAIRSRVPGSRVGKTLKSATRDDQTATYMRYVRSFRTFLDINDDKSSLNRFLPFFLMITSPKIVRKSGKYVLLEKNLKIFLCCKCCKKFAK